jgi:hypothetical protein
MLFSGNKSYIAVTPPATFYEHLCVVHTGGFFYFVRACPAQSPPDGIKAVGSKNAPDN